MFAEFPRNALEGYDRPNGELDESVNNLHNLVHSMLNGTSALSHSAANDPIFVVSVWSYGSKGLKCLEEGCQKTGPFYWETEIKKGQCIVLHRQEASCGTRP